MKFAKKMSLLLTLAAAVTTTAFAADGQATFILPYAAHIGAGVLPAGEYKVTMFADGATKAFISPVNKGTTGMIVLPVTTDGHATCSSSSLSLQRVGPNWSVRSICFAESQIALYFPVSTEKSTMTAAETDTSAMAAAK